MCEKYNTSLWSPNKSGAKISVFNQLFEKNIFSREIFLKKVPKMYVFGFSPFWKMNFDKSKVIFCNTFGIFKMWYDKMVPSLF